MVTEYKSLDKIRSITSQRGAIDLTRASHKSFGGFDVADASGCLSYINLQYRDGKDGDKAMGVKAGYPDLILDIARNGYHGLRVELKTDKGRLQASQITRLAMLNDEGYLPVVCRGYDEAVGTLKSYMGIE